MGIFDKREKVNITENETVNTNKRETTNKKYFQIIFEKNFYEVVVKRAKSLGQTRSSYIKSLILNDLKSANLI